MPMEPGRMLAHYRLVEKIGEGGMGVVWKAVDTQLDREVAVKLLPAELSASAEQLARLEREAKLLAQINHPNIATIHGLHEADGIRFLAMELAPGADLADRLQNGPLSVKEALGVAVQLAHALEAAHDRGVVHRDLKPANLKVAGDGTLKVLDFGLAKPTAPAGSQPDASLSPTLTAQMTQAGVILGTASYMSPEQARGHTADRRADLWAFGVILYEMLTGRRLFGGGTVTDILAAVVTREPDWNELPPDTPAQVRRLLAACLQKEPDRRLHHAADARIAVQEGIDRPELAGSPAAGRKASAVWLAAAALAGVLLGAALWAGLAPRQGAQAPDEPTMLELTFPAGHEPRALTVTRDGRALAWIAETAGDDGGPAIRRAFLRRLDGFEARALAGTEHATWVSFSPDGRWLSFHVSEEGESAGHIRKLALGGGLSITLASGISTGWGNSRGEWRDDGTLLVPDGTDVLARLPEDGGTPEPIVDLTAENAVILGSSSLPDGDHVLVSIGYVSEGGLMGRIELLSLSTGERTLLRDRAAGGYHPAGYLLGWSPDGYVAVPFDPDGLELTGPPTPLFSKDDTVLVSESGTLFHQPGRADRRVLVLVDMEGNIDPLDGLERGLPRGVGPGRVRWSPDGKRVSVTSFDDQWRSQLFVYDVERAALTRLGFPGQYIYELDWEPTGQRIAFNAMSGEKERGIYVRLASGSDTPSLLHAVAEGTKTEVTSWSPDGRVLLCNHQDAEGGSDLVLLTADGGELTPFVATPAWEHGGRFSPDGRWIVFESDGSGRKEVYIAAYPGEGAGGSSLKIRVSTAGGEEPVWDRDGRTIYFLDADLQLRAAAVDGLHGDSPTIGAGRALFDLKSANLVAGSYDLHPDGKRFVFKREEPGSAPAIRVTLGWMTELRRRLAEGS